MLHYAIELQTVFADEFLQIDLDESIGYIATEWLQHPTSKEFRAHTEVSANLVLQHRCKYWLSDALAVHYLEIADQNWLLRELVPRLVHSSLQKYARVMAPENMVMMDMERICSKIDEDPVLRENTTQVRVFFNRQEAIDWLLEDEN